jgi:hypothetical protein
MRRVEPSWIGLRGSAPSPAGWCETIAAVAEKGPAAGWYDDPQRPGTLRWWDGTAWTEHTRARLPPPAPGQAAAPPTSGSSAAWAWVLGVAALAVAAVVVLLLVVGGADSSLESDNAADADTRAQVRMAQTAMETFATDNGGSYRGVTLESLGEIEPSLSLEKIAVTGEDQAYVITGTSESGTEFALAMNAGLVSYSCSRPGTGGCPDSGDWADLSP